MMQFESITELMPLSLRKITDPDGPINEDVLLRRLRRVRNHVLFMTDWTQVQDATADKEAWAEFRQALRDMPENIRDPEFPDWPEHPE